MTQDEYIQILCDDLMFNIPVRNLILTELAQRPIKHIDELTAREKSMVIDDLKSRKHAGRPPRTNRDDSYAERGIVENEGRKPD